MFRSNDGGQIWSKFDGSSAAQEPIELPTNSIRSLFVDHNQTVFVGAESAPIFVISQLNEVNNPNDQSAGFSARIVESATGKHTLMISMEASESVGVRVYNILGEVVMNIPSQLLTEGVHSLDLPLDGVPHGTYSVSIKTPSITKAVQLSH